MLPAVAEVVLVLQARVGRRQDLVHAVLPARQWGVAIEIIQRHPEARSAFAPIPRTEFVQVGVVPAERALDGDVQVPEGAIARHLEATPDQRLDVQ